MTPFLQMAGRSGTTFDDATFTRGSGLGGTASLTNGATFSYDIGKNCTTWCTIASYL